MSAARGPYTVLYHHRTGAADGQRVHIVETLNALRSLGHVVYEVAPVPASERAGMSPRQTLPRQIAERVSTTAPAAGRSLLELAYNLPGAASLAQAVWRHDPDFIYERYCLNAVAGVVVAKATRTPLLLEVNSPLADEQRGTGRTRGYRLAHRLERLAFRRATRVLAVTAVLKDLIEAQAALPPGRVVVHPNGVTPDRFGDATRRRQTRAALNLSDRVVVGMAAFFREWHGTDRLVAWLAARSAAAAHLLLVGDGPALPRVKQLVEARGLAARVTCTGAVPHDRVPALIDAMDVAVMPAAAGYASPLKLFEYMAAGLPMVVPRQANILEIVSDGVDARCFEPGNADSFERSLDDLVADPALRQRLGGGARAAIGGRRLTWRDNAARILETFEDAIASGAVP